MILTVSRTKDDAMSAAAEVLSALRACRSSILDPDRHGQKSPYKHTSSRSTTFRAFRKVGSPCLPTPPSPPPRRQMCATEEGAGPR